MRRTLLCLMLGTAALATRATEGSLTVTVRHGPALLADAVVSVTPLDPVPVPAGLPEAVIVQEDREYDPYVTPVMVGTRISFPNRDSVQHHIYSLSKPKRFEKPLYASGSAESVLFDQPGVVTLGCNIHDWMIAYVVVLPTPYFAKTGAGGEVVFGALPPGRYRLEVWHPRLARPAVRELSLAAGINPAEAFTLQLKPDRRIRRAPGGKSSGY